MYTAATRDEETQQTGLFAGSPNTLPDRLRSPRTGIVLHSLVRPCGVALAVGFNSLLRYRSAVAKSVKSLSLSRLRFHDRSDGTMNGRILMA